MIIAIFALIAVAILLRTVPIKWASNGVGVDQWVWRALIEEVRKGSKLPPNLPKFMLDEKQLTPPLFLVLMARLPRAVFDKYASWVAVLIDILRLLLVIVATRELSGSDSAAILAGCAYSLTPLLVTYNLQLNPRGLAALMMDIVLLCVTSYVFMDMSIWLLIPAVVVSALVLLTHKMTTQLLWFLSASGALVTLRPELLLMIPASVVFALLLSGGYYAYVLLAHADIVTFWYRNWRWSGSNPVLESPIYGSPGYESPSKYYRSGFKAWLRRLSFVIGFNPWMPTVLGLAFLSICNGYRPSTLESVFLVWTALIFTFGLATTLIPALRCIGQGYLYGYNGAFPAAVLLGLMWESLGGSWYWYLAAFVGIVACIAGLIAFFKAMLSSRTLRIDKNLDRAIEYLKTSPEGVVMCLPQHWHDAVAYRADKPVLFGGHGYGFKLIEPIFPRIMVPIPTLIAKHNVAYLLTVSGYCNDRFLNDLPPHNIVAFGDYQLYRFNR